MTTRKLIKKLLKNPLSLSGILLILFFILVAVFAPVIAPPSPRARDPYDMPRLGYSAEQAEALRGLLTGRPGLLLVAGAADLAGDRHRLALTREWTALGRLVVSLERRMHYRSELLVQLEFGKEGGLGFDAVAALALDMSPDVLLVDEVRDAAQAKALLEAVGAGALVVADIQAPSAVEALLQLVALGLSKDSLARMLLGVVERVAVRRLCPHCRTARPMSADEAELLGVSPPAEVHDKGGCGVCADGFLGKRTLYALWIADDELRERIRTVEPPGEPLVEWRGRNPLSLRHAAREAVLAGEVALADARSLLRGAAVPS